MSKKVYSFRLDADLADHVKEYAKSIGVSQATIVEALLAAFREGRLWTVPRPSAFPGAPSILPTRPFAEGVPPGSYPHRFKQATEADEENSP